ncbi:MAG: ribosome silencing factor [Saccharofermentans sp.]|nr:ribosome silencing factor [Saccharofermentans sp.]
MTSKEIVDKVVEALDSKKGIDIEVLDVADKTTLADYFVIASGSSTTQIKALADEVEYLVKTDLGLYADHVEGRSGDRWMLIDYRDVVVHVMHPEERANYNLEKLWSTITLDRPMDDDEE